MTLEVVIPAYQAEETIGRAVASAVAVAERVIVVDDGSTDGTAEVARRHGAHVVRQENQGASAARHHGASLLQGEAVVFLDADDELLADGVARSLQILSEDPGLAVAAGRVRALRPNGRSALLPRRLQVDTEIMLKVGYGPWPPAAQVIRVSAYRAAAALPIAELRPRFAEDFELILRLSLVGRIRQHETPSCVYSIFAGRSARNARESLDDKEVVRQHYAQACQYPVVPMSPARLRSSTAMFTARYSLAHGRDVRGARYLAAAFVWRASDHLLHLRRGPERGYATRPPLVVVPWLEGGGAQYSLREILKATGRAVDVVSLFDGCRDYADIERAAATFTRLDAPRGPLGVPLAWWRLRPHLRGRGTVYSLMRGSHLVLGIAPSSLRAARTAASFHQLPSVDSQDRLAALETALVKRYTRHCVLVTAPSLLACDELVSEGYATRDTVHVVQNLVAPRHLPPEPPTQHGGPCRLLVAGRLTTQKGLDRLGELLETLDDAVVVRIAGSGELEEHLARLAAGRNDIDLLGRVDDISGQLDWCDAVLMPSRFELNPIVVWEAWASGRPVVASDLPVFHSLAEHGPVLTFRDGRELGAVIRGLRAPGEPRRHYEAAIEAFRQREHESDIVRFLQGLDRTL